MHDESRWEPRDEPALVLRMLSGDEEAYEVFSRHYIPAVYRFAIARLDGNSQLAKDIVQATLCKVVTKLATYRGDGPLLGWLCACCRNEIAMHFRGAPREVSLEGDGLDAKAFRAPSYESPDEVLLSAETSEQVHLALDLIPERYAQVLGWKYVDGISVREISRRIDMSEKATESLMTRARASFRAAWLGLESPAASHRSRSEAQ
ncbi:MAG: RNA polymerase sigma factor [Acidobacteria bacterium]|nr:RNA polymerase sigma factor [Acidobacteriota bacterium]